LGRSVPSVTSAPRPESSSPRTCMRHGIFPLDVLAGLARPKRPATCGCFLESRWKWHRWSWLRAVAEIVNAAVTLLTGLRQFVARAHSATDSIHHRQISPYLHFPSSRLYGGCAHDLCPWTLSKAMRTVALVLALRSEGLRFRPRPVNPIRNCRRCTLAPSSSTFGLIYNSCESYLSLQNGGQKK